MPFKEPQLDSSAIPSLAPFVRMQTDRLTGEQILLGPEVAMNLTDSGVEILKLCDGIRSTQKIAEFLAREYDAPVEEILTDAQGFLDRLSNKGYVRWSKQ